MDLGMTVKLEISRCGKINIDGEIIDHLVTQFLAAVKDVSEAKSYDYKLMKELTFPAIKISAIRNAEDLTAN